MNPIVSVIVPTIDRPQPLAHALASIAAQDLQEVKVVVVNDGGEDAAAVVRRFQGCLDIRLVTLSANRGLSHARNVGIEASCGRYLAFLDDDDVYLAGHLGIAVESAETSGADMVYTNCLVSDRRVDVANSDAVEVEYSFDFPFHTDMLAVMNYIPVTAVVCRSLRDLGARFDSILSLHEDWDLWLRLTRHWGFRVHHVAKPTVVYHRIPQRQSITNQAATDAAHLGRYRTSHLAMARRWPAPAASRVCRYRDWVLAMYDNGLARLNAGRHLSHFYYERSVRILFDAFTGRQREADVPARLAQAVTPLGRRNGLR
jgi:glycosyltransferase involved in cell wall biosynthesis